MNGRANGNSALRIRIGLLGGTGLLMAMITMQACSKAAAGPNGGDVVSLKNGQAKAEVMANADTGEVMVHTWDRDLKTIQPIEGKSLVIGSGEKTVELQPHPTDTDPSGFSSRFYGQADWMRGGGVQHGWMAGADQNRQEFDWNHSWMGGQSHGEMWSGMGEHRLGMMGTPGPAGATGQMGDGHGMMGRGPNGRMGHK